MNRRRVTSAILILGLVLAQVLTAVAQSTPAASPVTEGGLPWWRSATCYEIFVRSYADSDGDGIGDIPGLIGKLDYLNDGHPGQGDDLGITCIWLMPVFESPSYHGYDVVDYRTIEPDYGTNDDVARLVTEAHNRGIRVILDLPLNHVSVENPWFRDASSDPSSPYRDWFIFSETDPGYTGPWGEEVWHKNPNGGGYYYGIFDRSMPDLNFRNPDVTKAMEEVADFWLEEMHVDGFRMDAIKHVIEDGEVQENTPETIAWIRGFAAHVRETDPEAFTIGEVMGTTTDGLQPYYPDGLDEFFHFQLAQTLVNSANFGNPRQLTGIVNGANDRLPDQRWGTFLTNHDQPRIATVLNGDADKLWVGGMLLLSLPGTPFIYYGEEIGMPGDKPDPDIRTPMQWSAEANGGFTTGRPYAPLQPGWETTNVAVERDDPNSVLTTYRTWSGARETHPALQHGAFVPLETDQPSVMAFLRQTADETLLVVINLGGKPVDALTITLPDGIGGSLTGEIPGPDANIAGGTVTIATMESRSGAIYEIVP